MSSIQELKKELSVLNSFLDIMNNSIDPGDEDSDIKHNIHVVDGVGLVGYKRVTSILIPIGNQDLFVCDIQDCHCVGHYVEEQEYCYCDGHKQRIITAKRYISDTGKGTGPKCKRIVKLDDGFIFEALIHMDGVAVYRPKKQASIYLKPWEFSVLQ